MKKMLVVFSFIVSFAISGIILASETDEKKVDLLPKPTVDELIEGQPTEKEKVELPKFRYVIRLTTSAKEVFTIEVDSTDPMNAVNSVMSGEGSHLVIVNNVEGELVMTFIAKEHITSIQTFKKPKEEPKKEVSKDLAT